MNFDDVIKKARTEIESMYDSKCDIIERQSIIENNITTNNNEVTVQEGKP